MELPDPLGRVLPELEAADFSEPMAPCATCVMVPSGIADPGRVRFTAKARCCTYHPTLANWLVGGALRAGGAGADAIRRRLNNLDGVDVMGIRPTADAARRYATRTPHTFGRDDTLTCPYWVEGPLGCSIHAHRNSVCRTWNCRTTHGARSTNAWIAARDLVHSLEISLAEAVAGEPGDDWADYFVRCHERARTIDPSTLRGPRTLALLARVQHQLRRREASLPLHPTPALRAWQIRDDHALLESWSPYDRVTVPSWIFELLGRLDGKTPWPEAVRATERAIGTSVPEDLVAHLWWRGLLGEPEDDEGGSVEVLPQ